MKLAVPPGTSSKKIKIFVRDTSSTSGAGLTGLAYNSSGLTWYYIKDGDSSTTSVTLATATLGTWTSGGFIVVDATNQPGVYEIGIPNAALSAGDCVMVLRGVTNMADVRIEIQTDVVNAAPTTLRGMAAAGSVSTITFDSNAVATTGYYANHIVWIIKGTGKGQCSLITSYANTRIATVVGFTTAPDTTSEYLVVPVANSIVLSSFTGTFSGSNFDATARGLLGTQNLALTGATSPAFNGVYTISTTPTQNNKEAYLCTSVGSIWWDGTQWILSLLQGTNGTNYWKSTGDETGPWVNGGGTTTGTIVVTPIKVPPSGKNRTLVTADASGYVTANLNGDLTATMKTSVTTAATAATPIAASVTGAVGSVTGNIGGNLVGNVNGNVAGSVGSVTGAVGSVTGSVGSVAGNVSGDVSGKVLGGGSSSITGSGVQASSVVGSVGSVTGSVGSVTGAVGSVTGNVGGDVAGKVLGGGSGTISGDGVRASSVTGAVGSVAANGITASSLASDAGNEIAAALLDLTDGVESSLTVREALRIIFSAVAGKLDGASGSTIHTRDSTDSKNRITATVDSSGNRTAVTLDKS